MCCKATENIRLHRVMQDKIGLVLPVQFDQLHEQSHILDWVDAIAMEMMDRDVKNLLITLCIKNKLIHWRHDDDFMSFVDELPDDVEPEIVNIPGGVGNNDDAFSFQSEVGVEAFAAELFFQCLNILLFRFRIDHQAIVSVNNNKIFQAFDDNEL